MRIKTLFDGLVPASVAVVEATSSDWEMGLFEEEESFVERARLTRVREFTAGRNCARRALMRCGGAASAIVVGEGRAPSFPPGFCGSITHTRTYCAAAVARLGQIVSVGIDVEENTHLDDDILPIITTPREGLLLSGLESIDKQHWTNFIFSAKEAFYKAFFPVVRQYVDFTQVELSPQWGTKTFHVKVLCPKLAAVFQTFSLLGRYDFVDSKIVTAAVFYSGR